METTFIYTLSDPRDNLVRYIGKSNNPKQRLKNHCNRARYRPTHKFNWIEQLRTLGLKPHLEILDIVLISEWKFWEQYWINQFQQWNFDLVNYCNGGQGLSYGNQTSFKKGFSPWNSGTANTINCIVCNKKFKVSPAQVKQGRKCCSHKCGSILKKQSTKITQFKKNSIPWNKGLNYKHEKNNSKSSYLLDSFLFSHCIILAIVSLPNLTLSSH
jgi:hypothetical protein